MLQKKDFDACLIGRNYFSYLFSFLLAKKGERVLVISDSRVSFGSSWTQSIGMLEKLSLKKMGEVLDLFPFKNLDHYLAPSPIQLVLGPKKFPKRIRIGSVASDNLKEFLSKAPWLFFPENENIENNLIKDLDLQIEESCRDFNHHQLNWSPFFQKIFQHFQLKCNEDASDTQFFIKNLIYLSQTFFQGKISDRLTEEEQQHLLLTLLSPRYLLKQEEFLLDLEECFASRGITLKISQIESFQYEGKRPGLLQLKSFEGIIRPKSIYFMGKINKTFPLTLFTGKNVESKIGHYRSCSFSLKTSNPYFKAMAGERILFSPMEKMGTKIPLWDLRFENQFTGVVCFLIADREGDRIEFYFNILKSILEKTLNELFPSLSVLPNDLQMTPLPEEEFWIDTKMDSSLNESDIQDKKGIHYMGSGKKSSFGPFSLLQDIYNRVEM